MTWGLAFRLRQGIKGSVWLLPAVGVVAGWALAILTVRIDSVLDVQSLWQYSASTATSLLAAIVGAMVALTGFVVTVVTLGVQMATGTFSPRYMRLWYRDGLLKGLLAWLIGTLSFSLMAIRFVEDSFVPDLTVSLASLAVVIGLVFFVVYLDRFLHRLRPVGVASYVAEEGRRAFVAWMQLINGPLAVLHSRSGNLPDTPPSLTVQSRSAGTIQAVDAHGLARFAKRYNCLIVFHRALGDFVPEGAPLCSIYGGQLPALTDQRLRSMVAMGVERTIEQDPPFAVRIMVDIAVRALSPAVNDPTTAVQILDHLGEALRNVGTSNLPSHTADAMSREVGVTIPIGSWDALLELAVTEIREYGMGSVQVMRRMRALLVELEQLVPPERRAAVIEQLRRLDATVERTFVGSEDLDLARQADSQGIGGPVVSRTVARRP